ncbi:YdcH family protein [Parvularcula lutaonensis]|uniref:YdcH family protein n=1 Tax=Parvularcula lutaonensis TaxID=491923 RepID=A0ABV7MCM0_9PROT|nr:DUF465 domain-containing protein [Parvularcula lutaonensis]GGY50351.1 hypothetical protein GCM10007148_18930 [Parvularcula lutaonensis]
MSIEARIDTLSHKHEALEAALAEERSHAAANDLRISDLKRRKLAIKDEMEQLRQMTLQPDQRPS